MSIVTLPRRFYEGFIAIGEGFQSFLLLILRLYWGYSFFQAGYGKYLNTAPVIEFFQSIGLPFPTLNAYLVTYVEMIGGMCLLLGFATRLVSIPLACTMLVALFITEWDVVKDIYSNSQKFITLVPFIYLLVCLITFAFGPGKFSIDYLLERYIFKRR